MKFLIILTCTATVLLTGSGCSSLYKFFNPPEKVKRRKPVASRNEIEDKDLPTSSIAPDLNEYEQNYLNQYYRDVEKNRRKNKKDIFKLF